MVEKKVRSEEKNIPIFVIAGKDPSLLNIECEQLLDRLLTPDERATGLFNPDPEQVSAAQIFDELRTLPFLSERRVVLVKNADDFISENRPLLESYFDNPSPTATLILTVSTWRKDTNLAKKLQKTGRLLTITEPKGGQIPVRLIQYAHDAHDKKLSFDAAQLLVDIAGDALGQLYTEIDKLALFADDQKTITAQHIESLIGHNRLYNAFAVIDAVLAREPAQAIDRLRKMFADDKTTEYTVVGAFAFHLRRMFNAKAMLQRGSPSYVVEKKLNIWSNKDAFFNQLRKISLSQIGQYIQQLAQTDYEIKTGRTKAQVAVEQLVLKLIAA
jgi:DNA polymerase-3 subunit delta